MELYSHLEDNGILILSGILVENESKVEKICIKKVTLDRCLSRHGVDMPSLSKAPLKRAYHFSLLSLHGAIESQ